MSSVIYQNTLFSFCMSCVININHINKLPADDEEKSKYHLTLPLSSVISCFILKRLPHVSCLTFFFLPLFIFLPVPPHLSSIS